MSRSAYNKTTCRYCGGRSSNCGFAQRSHENSNKCRASRGLAPLPSKGRFLAAYREAEDERLKRRKP